MHAQAPTILGALLVFFAAIIVGSSYAKFYNERTENYKKHMYVLEHECRSGRQLPQIQYNVMTYDGTSTNCSEALVFTSVPPFFGAAHDMWIASPFYALMYATDGRIQLAYALFGVVAIVAYIRYHFIHKSQRAVLDTFSSTRNGMHMAKSSIDQRPRLLVKTTPIQQLAEKLVHEATRPPVFIKSTSSHCGTAPHVVGTTVPSV